MEQEKTILLKIQLDTSQLEKNAKEAEKKLVDLRAEQSRMKTENLQGTVAYAKISEEIRINQKVLKDNASALAINEMQSKKTKSTGYDLMQQQKAIAVAFNNLTEEERENTAEGRKIAEQYKKINDTLRAGSESVNDGRRTVGLYKQAIIEANKEIRSLEKQVTQIGFAYGQTKKDIDSQTNALMQLKSTQNADAKAIQELESSIEELNDTLKTQEKALNESSNELQNQKDILVKTEVEAKKIGFVYGQNTESVKDLRTELKEMNDIMASTDANSEEYVKASVRAGELRDKLKEVKENTAALAGGTGFEKMSNTMGLLKDDLLNLDFAGVAEKAKTLQTVSQGMTFKEVTAGVKNMGSALISLGKTILANPLFLLVGVIAGVVAAWMYFQEEVETATEINDKLNDSIEKQTEILERSQEVTQRVANEKLRLMKAQGASEEELFKQQLEILRLEEDARLQNIQQLQYAIQDRKLILSKAYEEEDEELAKKIKSEIEADKKKLADLRSLNGKWQAETKILTAEYTKQQIEDEFAKNQKIKQQREQAAKEALDLANEIAKRTRELTIQGLELTLEKEIEIVNKQQDYKKNIAERVIKDEVERAKALLQIEVDRFNELAKLDEKERYNRIERLKDATNEEIQQLKGSSEEIAAQSKLIRENAQKQVELIDIEFNQREIDREEEKENLKLAINTATSNKITDLNNRKLTELEAQKIDEENILRQSGATEIEIAQSIADNEIEISRQKNKAIQEDDTKTQEEKLLAQKQHEAEIIDITQKSEKQITEIKKQEVEERKALQDEVVNASMQLIQDYYTIVNQELEKDLKETNRVTNEKIAKLDEQYTKGLISKDEYERQKLDLENKAAKKEREIKQKQWEKQRDADIITATINMAVATTKAYAQGGAYGAITAALVAGLGAAQIAIIANQEVPEFAGGGRVLSGQKVNASDGIPIKRANGDNRLATIKVGEIVTNERQQKFIESVAGRDIWARAGVKGFAMGGAVTDSGLTTQTVVDRIDAQIATKNDMIEVVSKMPNPIVFVEDINTGQENKVIVENSGII